MGHAVDTLPDELPDDWVDTSDFDEPEADAPAETPVSVPPGGDEPDVDWASLGDEDFLTKLAGSDTQPVKSTSPMPKMKDVVKTHEPSTGPEMEPGEEPEFGVPDEPSEFETPPAEPEEPPAPRAMAPDEEAETSMDWDELRVEDPDTAAAIERSNPEIADELRTFTRDPQGDLIMRTKAGTRLKWDPSKEDWLDMDDGGTPAGEF
jgi:hypothetical protein